MEKLGKPKPDSSSCHAEICDSSLDTVTDCSHSKLLKIFGVLTITFSIVEACIGAAVYSFAVNYRLGAWWISILAFFAGFCAIHTRNRGWVTGACILASISIGVTVIGSVVDSVAVSVLNGLSACVSKNPNDRNQYYGNSEDYSKADACLPSAGNYVPDGCYCVNHARDTCYQFTISSFTKSYGMGCGNVINTYIKLLSASAAFSIMTSICITIISMISCSILCCPTESPPIQYRKKKMGVKKVYVASITGIDESV